MVGVWVSSKVHFLNLGHMTEEPVYLLVVYLNYRKSSQEGKEKLTLKLRNPKHQYIKGMTSVLLLSMITF